MAEKQILFASADVGGAEELKRELGDAWAVTHAPSASAALAAVEAARFDVLAVDLDLFSGVDASFLNMIQKTDPQTIRLVFADESNHSRVMKDVPGQHQFIAKPCDASELKGIIERTFALNIWSANEDIRKLVSQVRALPPMPSLYLEIQAALQSPNVTIPQISGIIAKDMAMTTKLLQVLNSAGFGLTRKIHDLNEAVGILGFQTVKSMVITIKLMSDFDHIKPVYYSIDRLWRRSTAIARMARELTLLHTGDEALAESAFAAGLLHDVGEAVLAAAFDEQFQAVQFVAREEQLELWEVEKKNFGASHGELGAYLLGLWGMPLDLLETTAMHDHPSLCPNTAFAPVTAVHIAHVWESELNPDNGDGCPLPQLDTEYLSKLGLLNKLDAWRKALALPPLKKSSIAASKKTVRKPAPASKAPAKAAPVSGGHPWFMAIGFGIFLVVAWLAFGPVAHVAARIENSFGIGLPEPAPITPRRYVPPGTNSDQLSGNAAATGSTNIAASITASTDNTSTKVVFPDMKLQGVFYSTKNASAIINGRLIHLNAEIDGARVIEITNTSVTVEFQGQKLKLSL